MLLVVSSPLRAAEYPEPASGDYILRDFRFASGEMLPELRIHYRTVGTPRRDEDGVVRNAVLILHGTTGSGRTSSGPSSRANSSARASPSTRPATYLILPDGIGHGGSSKPSDGLRARFPRYGYRDMIEAQYRLLTEGLKVDHLRLVMGTSMGGMHTWLWGETHPDFMDALLPLASLPDPDLGAKPGLAADHHRRHPQRPRVGRAATTATSRRACGPPPRCSSSWRATRSSGRRRRRPARRRTRSSTTTWRGVRTTDANDVLYAVESSADYDPGPGLERITAPLLAINFEDDLINPPELGVLEREIRRVKRGKAVVIPRSDRTRGHGTHTLAAVWKEHLVGLLAATEPASPDGHGDKVLFHEHFSPGLGEGWSWVREEPRAWRVEEAHL